MKKTFKERLEELQGEKTQKEFARSLGIPLNTYTNWLLHSRRPTMDAIISICTKLGESADWLLGLREQRWVDDEHHIECSDFAWKSRALAAEHKLEKVNKALSHALKGFEELQEAVK